MRCPYCGLEVLSLAKYIEIVHPERSQKNVLGSASIYQQLNEKHKEKWKEEIKRIKYVGNTLTPWRVMQAATHRIYYGKLAQLRKHLVKTANATLKVEAETTLPCH